MRKLVMGGLAALVLSCSDGAVGRRHTDCANPGEVKEEVCGINGEGVETYRCEDDHLWNKLSGCSGTDVCKNGKSLDNCSTGEHKICADGHWTGCFPKDCSDGDVLKDVCGPNGRDDMVCVDGEYKCNLKDECVLGSVKEDYFGLTKENIEPCQPGIEECKDVDGIAKYVLVQKKKLPSLEYCDGVDNDCDGVVDSDWYPDLGERCVVGVGGCANKGVYVCGDDKDSVKCNVSPKEGYAEFCDGLDNDCDGVVDNIEDRVIDCGLNGRGFVKQSCVSSEWKDNGSCDDPDECVDGSSEEENCGYNNRGIKIRDCVDGHWGNYGECADPDECADGSEREFYSGIAGSLNVGVCKSGVESCVDGRWTVKVDEVLPSTEICDGLDNDCDGNSDEGFNVGNSCIGDRGICADYTGVIECLSDGSSGCSVNPGGSEYPGGDEDSIEYCDGLDNDCSGVIDDGYCRVNIPAGNAVVGCNPGNTNCGSILVNTLEEKYISRFDITRFLITVKQWECLMNDNCNYSGTDKDYPKITDFNSAQSYCTALGGKIPGNDKWEKACRGTDGLVFPWGNRINDLSQEGCDYASFKLGSPVNENCENGYAPVDKRPKGISPFGVYDCIGNARKHVMLGSKIISKPNNYDEPIQVVGYIGTPDPNSAFYCIWDD